MAETFVPRYQQVMIDAGIPAEDQPLLALGMNRYLNMVGGCRPSDAMRSEVAEYQRLGAAEYRIKFDKDSRWFREMGY